MADSEFTPQQIARMKNAAICLWIGFLYAVATMVVGNSGILTGALVFVLFAGSSYPEIGRSWLVTGATVALFAILLALNGLLPSGEQIRTFGGQATAIFRGPAG